MKWMCIGLCWLFFFTCTTSSTTLNISKKETETISSETASTSISAVTAKLERHTTESSSYKKESQYESSSSVKCQSSDENQSTVSSCESSEISLSDRESQYESSSSENCQSSDEIQSTVSSCESSEISCPDREKFCAGKPNEEYTKEKTSCPPEICVSLVSRYDCSDAPPPSPGCACLSGYLRLNETSPCIAICDCPEMASSPDCLHQKPACTDPNEEFVQEKSTCPGDTCEALVARYDCSKAPPPKPGCTCKSGYRRLSGTSQCVPICDCPQMAHSVQCEKPEHSCKDPNEEYVREKSTCPPETCFSIIAFYDCQDAPPSLPGCACKSGYLRLNETSRCIPSCQCPQISSSPECQALETKCKDPNEEFVQEKSTCPGDTCEALVARYDCSKAPPPKPGCTCKSGYRRLNATSQCVPLCDCPQMTYSVQCQKPEQSCKGPNEEYVQEKRTCPPEQCFSIVADIDCRNSPPPSPGCACKSGFLRLNETSPCIPTCQCPELSSSPECQALEPTCKDPNEEFVQEKSTCPADTCEALVARYDCSKAPPPEPGCTCKPGYRRLNATSQCVPICDCPQMVNSEQCQKPNHCCKGPNEEYVQKKRNCPPETCISIVSKYDCSKFPPPKPGCACKSGYLRLNASSPCIPICKCPQLANSLDCLNKSCKGPNEEFVQEKSTCPGDTCEALVARYDCSKAPPPEPGCTCKSGYRRLNATSQCVPICDCPQMANSEQCQKPTHCCKDPNEEYVQKKRNCPPETCISIVSKYDCSKFPPPKPGCACKSGYLRLNASSPCIPICKCPQLANSLDCLNKSCKGPNEEFVQEKSTCPGDTCEALVARYDCSKAPPPEPGCTCKSGYRRLNATSQCVPICDCPQMANSEQCQKPTHCCKGPNEEYVQKKRNCPPETCISIVSKYDCSKFPPPKPGCACKSGYLRLNASSPCIPICKCPQLANSLDCLNKSCKGPNEEFVQEKSTCPGDTCEALVARYDCSKAPPPEPGCTCKSGYRRLNATSQCVPICDCPQMANSDQCQKPTHCCKGPNEEYVQKKRNCPPETCISIVSKYDCSKFPPPKPGCACKSGYLRLNASSPCIPICKCPQLANSLDCLNKSCKGPNEEFVQEKSTCPGDTCEALVARYDCSKAPPPEPGCTCKSGYRRLNATSQCVPICDCPQMANSEQCQKPKHCCKGPNEEYVQKKRNCPPETCISIVSKYDCSKFPPPKPGCACKSGYLRLNASSPCIPICKCPQLANSLDCLNKSCKGPNEEFVQKKSTCPGDTCKALVARYDCSKAPPPEPGCTCKSGYRRLNATSQCVPICDCPQMANSEQCQKPKHCCKGPNEEYVQKKRNCPPETCISIVSKYDCSKFPPPKPGCACKSGYLRLNASSPCIPICKCPQLANSLDCLNKSCKGPNEEFVQEKSTCPGDTCEALVARYDCSKAPPPEPGCTCKSGYRRLNATSQCVPICDCPQMVNSEQCQKPKHCCKGPNEEYVQKKRNCPPETCISIVSKYDCSKFPPPKPGCACKSGYLRLNASSPCIPICKCPQLANSLDCLNKSCKGPNEEFVQEKSTCPGDTCEALVARYDCSKAPPPEPGCTCKSGYCRLNATSQCVPICDCPQMANSEQCQKPKHCCKGPNEEYVQKKRNCPPETCISIVSKYDCSKFPPPKPGCACKSGYLRLNASSPCIPICKCPQLANSLDCLSKSCKGPNEDFVQEKSTCPGDTCEALVARYDCSKAPPPEPGCTCKSGYRRLNATSQCVPICDCPQMANSEQCQKPKHCCKGPNEEYVQKKRNCPPETCISIVSKYDCSKFPPSKPGCACKSGYLRLNASSPCIPICKCPQLANSLDCLNKSCKGPNEEFVQEKSTCPGDTCEALVARYDCSKAPPPEPGCTCKSGYRRLNATSQCVPICDCPQMANSEQCQKPKHCCKGPNEEYVQKKRNCPPETCISIVSKYDCSKFPPSKPGCACKSGYLRLNASSPCIPICKCPQLANSLDCLNKSCKGPNEEFVQKKSTCPGDTCEALVARYDCSKAPPPEPGCTCKCGYRRLNATSQCVPICDCPQMANSEQCQKPKHCCKGPNEEYVQKKRNCPPETCISIVSKYDCSKFPPSKPGCACKSGYLRLNASSPCIPICKCPQLANSLDCLNKSCKGPNEEFVQEKSTCPGDTCEALVARYDCSKAPPPEPGCTCKSGYRRLNATSQCVPICDCPQMANSEQCQKPKHCCKGPNEEYVQKKRNCPPETCISIVSKYDCSKFPPPKPGCACKSGYLRLNASSPCIPICKCPQLANSLDCLNKSCKGPNEDFVQEKSTCPGDTCEALVARYDCSKAPPPEPGCTCKSGYRRLNATSQCVPICDCPQIANSEQCQKPKHCCKGPNEEYVQKKRNCPPETCISIVSKYDCSKFPPSKPGCACKSGYLRLNASSPCIPICKCPQLANSLDCLNKSCKGPNEEFVQEKSTCPGDTCEALVARYDCSKAPPPEPGCTCKSGYSRLNATSQCVPICDCPQMANSEQCQKPKHCCKGPNEEYVQKKRNCPPETCISIVSKYDCSKFPPPKPGCACKSGYLRLNASSPCIPICKCPQVANSIECLKKSCIGPNEEFVLEKRSCPSETCVSLVARFNCTDAPAPKPGCACKSGYLRLNETSPCMPTCKCPQMASAPQCQSQEPPCCKKSLPIH